MRKNKLKLLKNLPERATAMLLALVFIPFQAGFSDTSRTKEENVYVNLNYDGSVQEVNVINAFKTDGATKIVDYGDYSQLKNLSSETEPKVKSNMIEWQTAANSDSFYYQGKMKTAQLPFNFKFTYRLNGKDVKAEELKGATGHIKLIIKTDSNEKANDYFRDNYIAQISLSLDTEKCTGIYAPDAMAANVGSKKSLTLMNLPKMDKTYEIEFDAKDFEFDGITIALVKISDGILGKVDSVKTSVTGISGSINSLVSGTGELRGGAESLASGLSLLNSGASSMTQLAPLFKSGFSELSGGIYSLNDGLNQLSAGSSQVRDGISNLNSKSGEILNGISSVSGGLNEITKNKNTVKSGIAKLEESGSQITTLKNSALTLKSGYGEIYSGVQQIASNKAQVSSQLAALRAMKSQLTSGLTAEQATQLKVLGVLDKIEALYAAAEGFGQAAEKMAEGAVTINQNLATLNNGFSTFCSGLSNVDTLYSSALGSAKGAYTIIEGAEKLKKGTDSLYSGFEQYAEGVGTLADSYPEIDNGLSDAKTGSDTLKTGAGTMEASVDSVISSMGTLTDSIETLSRGADSLYGGTERLDSGAESFGSALSGADINALINASEGAEAVSFTAPNLNKVSSVQFVVKSPSIKLDDEAEVTGEDESSNFFIKLYELFASKSGKAGPFAGIALATVIVLYICYEIYKFTFGKKKTKKTKNELPKMSEAQKKPNENKTENKPENKKEDAGGESGRNETNIES